MKKVKIGVMGAYRGTGAINYCRIANNAEVVAICDKWVEGLERQKEICGTDGITYYTNFDEFINHDMDAVVLANYATEHAPFAVRCFEKGLHVFSECLPCQTMKEAVELIEAVEKTGLVYAYAENFCYMPAPYEMKRLYQEGKIGEFEYGECEYIHNLEPIYPGITYGEEDHWRNNWYATFYCTHSIGPIIHATGLKPVKVTGFESKMNERKLRVGGKSGLFGIEMIELENGGIIKSIHGDLYTDSHWYSMYGSKGHMECARQDTNNGGIHRLYLKYDEAPGVYDFKEENYIPLDEHSDAAKMFGHGGADFYSMWHFVEKILGNDEADVIDIYEAMDMFLPGHFAYRSVLEGGIPLEIPDFRKKEDRDKWRNDTACTDPKVAGDMLWPTFSSGTPKIPGQVYENIRQKWRKEFEENTGYTKAAFTQSSEEMDPNDAGAKAITID